MKWTTCSTSQSLLFKSFNSTVPLPLPLPFLGEPDVLRAWWDPGQLGRFWGGSWGYEVCDTRDISPLLLGLTLTSGIFFGRISSAATSSAWGSLIYLPWHLSSSIFSFFIFLVFAFVSTKWYISMIMLIWRRLLTEHRPVLIVWCRPPLSLLVAWHNIYFPFSRLVTLIQTRYFHLFLLNDHLRWIEHNL